MKEVCKNCKKFIEKEDEVVYVYRYCCDPEEGRQEITNCVTDFDKPDWCPGFVKPPEELPEDMEKIFKSRAVPASYLNIKATTATKSFLEEESMSEFNATRQLKELKCELERKYYHLYDVDDPVNTIVQNAREVLHKQRVAIINKDNKIKELREQLEKLQDYITKKYPNYCRHEEEDIIDVVIGINDRLKTMANHLKKDREDLEYKLTKLSNSFICGMMSQLGIKDLERCVKETEKKDNKLAKEVAEVKAYLDHKYPEFYEEHGQRRFSDVIKLLVLKLDG